MNETLEVRAISDYHLHLRQEDALRTLVPFSAAQCGRFLVMPNTVPGITDYIGMLRYREDIREYLPPDVEVLMTMKLQEDTLPETIIECAENGCTAVKIYPEGVTSNSTNGISRDVIKSLINSAYTTQEKMFHKNLETIEKTGMALCWHGEMPGEEVLVREAAIFPYIASALEKFPKLRMVFEHVTTERVIDKIANIQHWFKGRLAATITPHHMRHTLTDLAGGLLHPHLFCKPLLKNHKDRIALVRAAISGAPWCFLGSDSAPWRQSKKECRECCAGVWNSPCLLETLADIFDEQFSLDKLENFTSGFGDRFYGKEPVDAMIRLEKDDPWVMPELIEGMVPYRAGDVINWKMQGKFRRNGEGVGVQYFEEGGATTD